MSAPPESSAHPPATPLGANGDASRQLPRRRSLGAVLAAALASNLLVATAISYGVREVLGLYAVTGPTYFGLIWAALIPFWGWLAFRYRVTRRGVVALCLLLLAAGTGACLVGHAAVEARMTSKKKAILFRQITAAMDQYFLETGSHVVENYDDLVGPEKYIKHQTSADGEEFRTMFPLYQFTPALSVRASDGSLVSFPCRFDLPTDPPIRFAPAEPFHPGGGSPAADGVHQKVMPDGIRLEVAYRDGVPHGPFRAYHANGTLWGEGLYDDGLPVSSRHRPSQPGSESPSAAAFEAQGYFVRGLNRFFMGDLPAAVSRFTRAIELKTNRPEAFEFRGRARLRQGDVLGACGDFLRGAALRRANRDEFCEAGPMARRP